MATFQQLSSGNWRILFYVDNIDGTRIRKSLTAPTREEAEKLAEDYIKNGLRLTVGEALDGYIDLKRNVLSPSTVYGYEVIRRNRLQYIMDIEIHKLNSIAMQKAINADATESTRNTINKAMNLVMSALRLYGVKLDLHVTLPPQKPKFKELPSPLEVIQMIRGTEVELPCLLALWLSLRISEVRGLQFGDLKNGVLTVQRSRLRLGSTDSQCNIGLYCKEHKYRFSAHK